MAKKRKDVQELKIERPKRAKLSEEETLRRMKAFDEHTRAISHRLLECGFNCGSFRERQRHTLSEVSIPRFHDDRSAQLARCCPCVCGVFH